MDQLYNWIQNKKDIQNDHPITLTKHATHHPMKSKHTQDQDSGPKDKFQIQTQNPNIQVLSGCDT